jgi:hypothetical protein
MEEHESNGEAAIGGAAKVTVVMLDWIFFLPPLVSSSHGQGDLYLRARDLCSSGRHRHYLEASRPSRWREKRISWNAPEPLTPAALLATNAESDGPKISGRRG